MYQMLARMYELRPAQAAGRAPVLSFRTIQEFSDCYYATDDGIRSAWNTLGGDGRTPDSLGTPRGARRNEGPPAAALELDGEFDPGSG